MVDCSDVIAARSRIESHVRRTPVIGLERTALGLDYDLTLKLESLQRGGSFKIRGAFNALLAADSLDRGVVAASGGNFGLGVALAASELGVPATIFVPGVIASAKLGALRAVPGVDVEVRPGVYLDAFEGAQEHRERTGAQMLHPYDQPEVVAGQGTCGLELREDVALDTVLVAVGGGGLMAGIVAAYERAVSVIAVETEGTPTLRTALSEGASAAVEVSGLAADSLGASRIGALGLEAARYGVDESLLVSDEAVLEAQRRLWAGSRIVAEPGGATALAPLLTGAYVPAPDERVGVIVCGANTELGFPAPGRR